MKWLCGGLGLALACQPAAAGEPALVATIDIVGTGPMTGLGIERKLLPYSLQLAASSRIGQRMPLLWRTT